MSAVEPAHMRAASATAWSPRTLAVLGACAIILLVAPIWQLRWGTVADTSWLITVAERMLGGERLYVDVIETNPPFAIWLYYPVVALAHRLGVAPETLVQLYAYVVSLVGLGFAAFVARRANFAENRALFALLPVFLVLFVIFPGNAFTEREQFGVALLAPLMVLTAWRVSTTPGEGPSLVLAGFAGLAASVIVLVKPYYALVILAPALYLAWKKRSIRPLFGIEYWVIGTVAVAYLVAVFWAYPQFMRDLYPMLSSVYLPVRAPYDLLLERNAAGYLILVFAMKRLRPDVSLSPLATVLLLGSVAGAAVFAYQAKGWPYHAYPAMALGLAALFVHIAQPAREDEAPFSRVQKAIVTLTVLACSVPFFASQKPGSALVASLRAVGVNPGIALVGTDIARGHPITRDLGGRWISPYCSDWLGTYTLYLSMVAETKGDADAAARYRAISDDYVADKIARLQREKPEILLVQKEDALWLDRLRESAEFDAFMRAYRIVGEDADTRAYARGSEAALQ